VSVPYATVPSDGVLASIFASVSNVEIVNPELPAVAVAVAEPPMTILPVAAPDTPVPRVAVALPPTIMLPVAVALVVDEPIEVTPVAEPPMTILPVATPFAPSDVPAVALPPITTLPVAEGLTIVLVDVDAVADPPMTILPVALYVVGAPHGIGNETGKLRGQQVEDGVAELPPITTLPVADAD